MKRAFVMVGAPGSGKSTYALEIAKNYEDAVIVSTDSIRFQLYGNEDIQGNYWEINLRKEEIIKESQGSTIILDATHYCSKYRKETISLLNLYGYENITAVVIKKPLKVCLYQNSQRDRKVPEEVIKKMFSSLMSSITHLPNEGFSQIVEVS